MSCSWTRSVIEIFGRPDAMYIDGTFIKTLIATLEPLCRDPGRSMLASRCDGYRR